MLLCKTVVARCLALLLVFSPLFFEGRAAAQQSGSVITAAPLLRRVETKHHGFDGATLNDAKLSELEAYEVKYRQDLPTVETAYDQKKVDNMKKVLEDFWKERGIAVEVRTTVTQVAKARRYAVLEFDVYKQ